MVIEMQCPSCKYKNPEDSLFCRECGFSLEIEITCPNCNATHPPGSKFCNKCGHDLTQSAPAKSATPETSPTKIPTAFADGRYEVKEFLGEGGKKKVYKAYDTLLDRDIALALIKIEGLDEDSRTRITREAQAMGRLGAHANIVTVFDLGDHEGQPYIVQELMGGSDVEKLIEEAPDHRLPIDQATEIAQSVCAGLEFAHNKGVIHRDIKPSNIWLTEDGTVKIGDFGLALVDDRTRLTQEGMTVGTVSYLPPEQAVGGEITIQSDLYSLGVMLYEMVTGRPPFVGDDSVAIIGQHLNTPPVSPSWHNPEIPQALEVLILRLLEKSAAKRSASASEVSRALESIQKGGEEEEPQKEDVRTEKSGPLYRQVFVGRENELNQLKAAFDNALSGEGSLSMVVGEPGIGKTSLVEQLSTYVAMRDGLTLVGHCYEEGSLSLPYLAFVEAMRTYVLDRDISDLRNELGSGASEVARIVSEVRDRLQVEPRTATNPDEDRYRLFQAVTDFLSNAANIQPLLIVLEDLHDSDKGTLDLLTHITRRMDKGRLLIVGTYRDVEVDRAHPLTNTLAELRRVSSYNRILLRGLTIDEVHRMLSGLSGQDVPWRMAEVVHRQTEGNPLFVQEVLRYVVEDGLLVREGDQWRTASADRLAASIPEGLRDVIGKRLSTLSPECNQVLAVASVIGREFRFEVLQKVANVTEDLLYAAIEEARTTAVIEERTSIGAMVSYWFTHAFFRQTLYEEMIAPRRNSLHQQVAKALEELYAERLADHAAELFDHFSNSNYPEDLEKAVKYGEMSADRASGVFDYGEAARLLEQTLQVQEVLDPEDEAKRCDLLLALSYALMNAREPRHALDTELPLAFSLAESIADEERATEACRLAFEAFWYWGGGTTNIWITEEAIEWINRMDIYAKPETPERAYADFYRGFVNFSTKRVRKGFEEMKQALKLARKIDDNEAFIRTGSFWLLYSATPQAFKEQLKVAEEISHYSRTGVDMGIHVISLFAVANTFLEYEKRDRCEELWSEMEKFTERSGHGNYVLLLMTKQAILSTLDGRLDETIQITDDMLVQGRELNLARFAAASYFFSGMRANVFLGYEERLLQRIEPSPGNMNHRALLFARLNRRDEAIELLDEMLALRRSIGTPDYQYYWNDIIFLEAAVLAEHREAAEAFYRQLAGWSPNITSFYYATCVPRHLGAASTLLGRFEQARMHYDEALTATTNVRFRPEYALTRLQLAELQLKHCPDEKLEAVESLNFAIDEFTEMKMQPSLKKTQDLKEMHGL